MLVYQLIFLIFNQITVDNFRVLYRYINKRVVISCAMYCRVYNIGIVVRQGRGRYQNTNIVTFSPRYQLENRSSHKLAFVQKHIIEGQVCFDDRLHVPYKCVMMM